MISIRELLSGQVDDIYKLDAKLQSNLLELFRKINIIRAAYGRPMIVTSGYRSMKHHLEIYAKKGITKIPMQSHHLFCEAVDISDPKGTLKLWCYENVGLLVSTGLWMEDFGSTQTWVHFQIVVPKSGKRFFRP